MEESHPFWILVDVFDFRIRDENLKHVYQYGYDHAYTALLTPIGPIQPGRNLARIEAWRQTFDGSGKVDASLAFTQVPPGVYFVTGVFDSPTYHKTLETPPIRIAIEP